MKVMTKPVTRLFKLKCDPEGLAEVTIKQMTTGDFLKRASLTEKQAFRNSGDVEVTWNAPEIQRYDAWLTLVGAHELQDEDGNELFQFKEGKNGSELNMDRGKFNRAWDILPRPVTDEIYGYILEVNPSIAGVVGEGE